MRIIHFWPLLLAAISAYSHEGGEMSVRTGPDQGILERSEEAGFKLSPEAIKRFSLGTIPAPAPGAINLPADAVVRSLAETGIYRQRDGFIKRIAIQGYSSRGGRAYFTAKDLRPGDLIIIKGVGFVRMIEAAFGSGESEEDHAKHGEKEKGDAHEHDEHEEKDKGSHDEHEGHGDEHESDTKGDHK